MTYDAKTLFSCPVCGKRKLLSESYPYKNKRICEDCWLSTLTKQGEEQEGNTKEANK